MQQKVFRTENELNLRQDEALFCGLASCTCQALTT